MATLVRLLFMALRMEARRPNSTLLVSGFGFGVGFLRLNGTALGTYGHSLRILHGTPKHFRKRTQLFRSLHVTLV